MSELLRFACELFHEWLRREDPIYRKLTDEIEFKRRADRARPVQGEHEILPYSENGRSEENKNDSSRPKKESIPA